VTTALAHAKLNLSLVVGPLLASGKHELVSVIAPIALADEVALERADELAVTGFPEDTLVRDALTRLAAAAGVEPRWMVAIEKQIPVAAGLGGGSSDAATALTLANQTLAQPLPAERLYEVAASVGADVPFFLEPGPKLARGDGTELSPLELPNDFVVLLVLPTDASKPSTGAVYADFDARGGEEGFEERRAALERVDDLFALPKNDLASSPLTHQLESLGAFRADVTGAGPAVYGLFQNESLALLAEQQVARAGRTWVTEPAW
jgi:4-diphosphocytidyl-2-C-methyl-D-erythritol kinase